MSASRLRGELVCYGGLVIEADRTCHGEYSPTTSLACLRTR